jgi:hypothetical protein
MLRNLTISTLLCVGAVSVAYADVFRWVDDHGGVHYSDQWVPGSELIKSSAKTHSQSSETASRTPPVAPKPSSSDSQSSQDTAAKAVKQDLAKVREQQCKDAKDRYDKAIQARRIYKPGPNSNDPNHADDRQFLSDDEADAYRVKTRQEVQDYCGASAIKPSGE